MLAEIEAVVADDDDERVLEPGLAAKALDELPDDVVRIAGGVEDPLARMARPVMSKPGSGGLNGV